MLSRLVAVFMVIGMAVVMFPFIKDSVETATTGMYSSSNLTSAFDTTNNFSITLLQTVPYFFIAVVVLTGVAMIWNAFRSDDGLESSESSSFTYTKKENITPKEEKPRYQGGRIPDKEKYIYGNDNNYKEDYFKKSKFD